MRWGVCGLAEAHPRACGENATRALEPCMGKGSSPRVRGKRHDFPVSGFASRLIPARAGKTRAPRNRGAANAAHPRACGENDAAAQLMSHQSGSSPRVRGKRMGTGLLIVRLRLIPARAGKTSAGVEGVGFRWAHPRACGENRRQIVVALMRAGSSPRVRGKLGPRGRELGAAGLIPARAGKTALSGVPETWCRAHPRACGENGMNSKGSSFPAGSSPRVRGKPPARTVAARAPGLIPARAGKTDRHGQVQEALPAHPRACGENYYFAIASHAILGSSPRVRGKQELPAEYMPLGGLIPARAGKTCCTTSRAGTITAHPRACGENYTPELVMLDEAGSSPRVRGKPRRRAPLHEHRRLIPARAGKTKKL